MPNYKGHLVGGAITFAAIVALTNTRTYPWIKLGEWLACTLGGALFPDIDVRSKGQKIFYRVLFVALIYLLFQQKIMTFMVVGLTAGVPLVVRHRGVFHNPWFVIFCSALPVLVAYFYSPNYLHLFFIDALFFCAGAFSHLILDRGVVKVIKQLVGIF